MAPSNGDYVHSRHRISVRAGLNDRACATGRGRSGRRAENDMVGECEALTVSGSTNLDGVQQRQFHGRCWWTWVFSFFDTQKREWTRFCIAGRFHHETVTPSSAA